MTNDSILFLIYVLMFISVLTVAGVLAELAISFADRYSVRYGDAVAGSVLKPRKKISQIFRELFR